MSHLLRDKYQLLVAADSVAVTKLQRGFPYIAYSAGAQSVHACATSIAAAVAASSAIPPAHAAGHNAHPWLVAIDTLDSLMAGFAPGSAVDIVLANQFVRYCILPAMPPFTPMGERNSMATQCFREIYGEAVDDWFIRVDPLPHGDSQLCCAVDRLLVERITALALRHRLKLASLQPAFMHGFNAARRQMRADPACFVQIEQGRVNLALISGGAWQSLASGLTENELLGQQGGLSNHWQAELLAMVSRDLLLAGWPAEQTAALTLYIDTSFVAGSVRVNALQHAQPQHLAQEQEQEQEQLAPEYSAWQFVYLAPSYQQPGTPASERATEAAQHILTPQRKVH